MPEGINYEGNALITLDSYTYSGESVINGKTILWYLTDDYGIELWDAPDGSADQINTVIIEFDAIVIDNGEQINTVEVTAVKMCSNINLFGYDTACVNIVEQDSDTIYVGGSGPGNYTKIQDAIDAANPGDTVYVYSGTYYENVVINKEIVLIGEDKNSTVIDGGGNDKVVHVSADSVGINDFTIRNSKRNWPGLKVTSDFNTITGNIIVNNGDEGIVLDGSSHNLISDNDITNNHYAGIRISGYFNPCSSNTISGNIITDNDGTAISIRDSPNNSIYSNSLTNNDGWGIYLWPGANYTSIVENTITYNGATGIQTCNMVNNIIITRNNISRNSGRGISIGGPQIGGTSHIDVTQNKIIENNGGTMLIYGLSNCVISKNYIKNSNQSGIMLFCSYNAAITDNTFIAKGGITLWGNLVNFFDSHNIENNTVNGKPIRYYKNTNDVTVPINTAQVILANCKNFKIQNLELSDSITGIQLAFSSDCTVINNEIKNNVFSSIFLTSSSNNNIIGNIVENTQFSDLGSIALVYSSHNNIISGNSIKNNFGGIAFNENSCDNRIYENDITDNYFGIAIGSDEVDESNGNIIYHNNFINNTYCQAYDNCCNQWNSTFGEGNYWDDYTGNDLDGDGIGDTPYNISGGDNQDFCPLMEPWAGDNEPQDITPPVTTCYLFGEMAQNGTQEYYKSSVLVRLRAVDNMNKIEEIAYRVDYGEWQHDYPSGPSDDIVVAHSCQFSVDTEGYHIVEFYAVDEVGNMENVNTIDIKIDKTSPRTNHKISGEIGDDGWYTSSVEITLESSDDLSGVKNIFYSIDRGPVIIYEDSFEIKNDGETVVNYYAVDVAGNIEKGQTIIIKIDTNAPETKSYLPRPVTYRQGIPVYNHAVEVTLKANDKTSGVKSTFYRECFGKIDMPWRLYEGAFFVTGNGLHTIEFYSIDNAGTVERTKSVSFIVYIPSHIDQIRDK